MKSEVKTALLSVIGVAVVLMAAGACDGGFGPAKGTLEVTSGKSPNASVRGTVTYRERLALTPGATLVVDLRDVSYADGAAPLIARQTISSPGQVPIRFEVGYNRDDVDSRNVYSVSVRIVESDGRLAFTNDTAHEVITRGKPNKVDMVLVLVQPPPDASGGGDEGGSDWRTWVETPVPVVWANLIPNEREHLLRVAYYQSTIEGCVRPGNQSLNVDGNDIVVRITLMQPPPTSWAIPCHEQVVELDTVEPIRSVSRARADLPGHSERPGDHHVHPAADRSSAHVHRRVARRQRRGGDIGRRGSGVRAADRLRLAQGQ